MLLRGQRRFVSARGPGTKACWVLHPEPRTRSLLSPDTRYRTLSEFRERERERVEGEEGEEGEEGLRLRERVDQLLVQATIPAMRPS